MGIQNPGSAVSTSSISFSHRWQESYKQASPLCLCPTCPARGHSARLGCIRMGLSQCQEHLKWAEQRHQQTKVLIVIFRISVSPNKRKGYVSKASFQLGCKLCHLLVIIQAKRQPVRWIPKAPLVLGPSNTMTCSHGNDATITPYPEELPWKNLHQISVCRCLCRSSC